jgi:hypothetical protein
MRRAPRAADTGRMTPSIVTERRFERVVALAGEARPGDVLTLPGGTLVKDANENGRVDTEDGRLRGRYVDVRV